MAMTYQQQPSSSPPTPQRGARVLMFVLLGALVLIVVMGVVLASGDDQAPTQPEDRSVTAGVQCEEAINQRLPRAEPETTRTERDGTRYTVGGHAADGQAFVCKITDEGDGSWTVTTLTLGSDDLLAG